MDQVLLTPSVVIATYLIAELLKYTVMRSDNSKKILPIICGIIGGCIGMALFIFYPEGTTATNLAAAFTSGAFSGLASTGCNQIYKQIKNFSNTDGNNEDEI